jgi:hypothetical protein
MKKQILFSLILALLFFTPSYAQDIDIPNELKELHNMPDLDSLDKKAKEDLKEIVSELEVEKSALFANAEEVDPNTATTNGLEASE